MNYVKKKLRCCEADSNLPYQDNTFDYEFDSLTSLQEEKDRIALEEMIRVCKDGGEILVGMVCRTRTTSNEKHQISLMVIIMSLGKMSSLLFYIW